MFMESCLSRPSIISTYLFLPVFLILDTDPSVSAEEASSTSRSLNLFQEPGDT